MVLKFTVEQVELVRRLRDTGIGVKDIEIIFNKLASLDESLKTTCDQRSLEQAAREQQPTAAPREANHATVEDEDEYSSSSSDSSTPSSPLPANTTFGTSMTNGPMNSDCTPLSGHSSPGGVQQHLSRRFQFRFTEPQLAVLRRAFSSNPYPEDEEKEAIADACNMAAMNAGDLAHTNVTSVMVHTWFSNRRKDATRMLKSNHVVKSSLPMTVSMLPHEALRRLTRQRERFSFDRGHLGILEGHYQRNNYPNQTEKEAIAEECNAYTAAHEVTSPPVVSSNNSNNTVNHSLWNADLSLRTPNGIGMVKEEPPDYETTSYDQEVLPDNGISWSIELDGNGTCHNSCIGNNALNGSGVMPMRTEVGPYSVKTEEDRWQLPSGNLQLDWR